MKKIKNTLLVILSCAFIVTTSSCGKRQENVSFEEFFRSYTKVYEEKIQKTAAERAKECDLYINETYSTKYNTVMVYDEEMCYFYKAARPDKIYVHAKIKSINYLENMWTYGSFKIIESKRNGVRFEDDAGLSSAYNYIRPDYFKVEDMIETSSESPLYYWYSSNGFCLSMDTEENIEQDSNGNYYIIKDGIAKKVIKTYVKVNEKYKDYTFGLYPFTIEINDDNYSEYIEINDDCLIKKHNKSGLVKLENGKKDKYYHKMTFKY